MNRVKEIFSIGQIKILRITNASIYITSQRITTYNVKSPKSLEPHIYRIAMGNVQRSWQLCTLHLSTLNYRKTHVFKSVLLRLFGVHKCSPQ